jgi:hypothetical protein
MTLETWVIEDGNYPLLNKNDKLNIAFNMEPYSIEIIENGNYLFEQIKYSEYNFCGKIIYKHSNIIVVDTGILKFYIELKNNFNVGTFINGNGKLLIDYFVWVENINKYKNHPDIFYNVIINKILAVKIPGKFISHFNGVISLPASIKSDDINENDIKEIKNMDNDFNGYGFYLMELEQINEKINRTFVM